MLSPLIVLPSPFEWVHIPAGKVSVISGNIIPGFAFRDKPRKIFDLSAFSISKYPVTNSQYRKFIEAKGYEQKKWWTDEGWEAKNRFNWLEPRYWQDKAWNGADYPVVGVSWYEAVAFCLWLSDFTGENVYLPTEQQWQRTAQGDDQRIFPWGNEWDDNQCNHDSTSTSPVTLYEGNSPYGVVDMAGNVWEWCLTKYGTNENDLDGDDDRVLKGGSWYSSDLEDFYVDYRDWDIPINRGNDWGFRIVRT